MKVLTIIRKNYPITVVRMKVRDLDDGRCNAKFKSHALGTEDDVYVKCDAAGNIEYRGKRMRYRIYDVKKHNVLLPCGNML